MVCFSMAWTKLFDSVPTLREAEKNLGTIHVAGCIIGPPSQDTKFCWFSERAVHSWLSSPWICRTSSALHPNIRLLPLAKTVLYERSDVIPLVIWQGLACFLCAMNSQPIWIDSCYIWLIPWIYFRKLYSWFLESVLSLSGGFSLTVKDSASKSTKNIGRSTTWCCWCRRFWLHRLLTTDFPYDLKLVNEFLMKVLDVSWVQQGAIWCCACPTVVITS